MKFAHIADIHNRNYQRHDQYRIAFAKTYEILKEEKPDAIVVCGDIAHTKTELSPEYISLSSEFIKNLSLLANRVDIILGNHDGNLRNKDRENAIAPLVKNLGLKNIYLHEKSGIVDINDKFRYAIFSCWDEENFPRLEPNDKVTIALFHGTVDGCKPDNYDNILVDHKIVLKSNYPLSLFDNCDYLLAGDIHKHQSMDKEGRFVYAGSLIQQNVGESTDKGFYIWDIKSKKEFSKARKNIYVPGMWATIKVNNKGETSRTFEIIPDESIVRLHYDSDIDKQLLANTVATLVVEHPTCKIEQIKNTVAEINTSKINQNNDIKSYLVGKKIADDVIEKVTKLDTDIKSKINLDDFYHGLIWQLIELEWSNLFSYGEDNKINLENLSGLIGIFGPNGIGKSSIIDILLWVLFNNISKKTKKNHWIIRDGTKEAKASAIIKANNGNIYKITRLINRKNKSNKETSQVSVEFSRTSSAGIVENLNGIDRVDTDKNIRQIFGTLDDFVMTSMVPAGMMNNFVNNIGSERFDLLSTFLGIGSFKLKHEAAKKMSGDLQHKIKATRIDFDKEIQDNNAQVIKYEVLCEDLKKQLDEQKQKSKELNGQIVALNKEITTTELYNCDEAITNLSKSESTIKVVQERLDELCQASGLCLGKIHFYDDKINNSLDESVVKTYLEAKNVEKDLNSKWTTMNAKENILSSSLKILDEVPCDNKECIFIRDAYNKKDQYEVLHSQSYSLMKDIKVISMDIEKLSIEYDKFRYIQEQNSKFMVEKSKFTTLYGKAQSGLAVSESVLNSAIKDVGLWKERVKIAEKQKEIFEKNKQLERDIERISIEKSVIDDAIDLKNIQYIKHLELFGKCKFMLEDSQKKKQEWAALNDEYAAYDEYIKLTSREGLPLSIVLKNLVNVNNEIATTLTNNGYDFSVYFQSNEDNEIEIFMKKDGLTRHLEVVSESEKYTASFLIRTSLLNICSLPKPSMFWIDETFGCYDPARLHGFMDLITYARNQFSHIFVISHVSAAKELVDHILDINQGNGISRCYNN